MLKRIVGVLLLLSVACVSVAEDRTVWIDVRSEEEFAREHLQEAVNIPHDEIGDKIGSLKLDPSTAIVVYCRSGRRAGVAKETLEQMGFESVVNAKNLEGARTLQQRQAEGEK